MSRVLAAAVGLLALAGCLERGPLAPPTLEPLEISVEGPWMRDRQGRVVLLRGATYTLTETGMEIGGFDGPGERTLAEMERLGMNLVRLPLSWALLEPRPGRHHPEYLMHRVDPVIRLAAAHGLAVVLSMRPWPRETCDQPDPAIPTWVCESIVAAGGAACDFWRATGPRERALRWYYARTWSLIAEHYSQDRRVVGFDPLDEPFAGDCFEATAFAAGQLAPFYHVLDQAVRAGGGVQPLLVEPPAGPRLPAFPPRPLGGPSLFSPHLWSQRYGPPPGDRLDGLRSAYDRAHADAQELDVPLIVGSYGANRARTPGAPFRGTSPRFVEASLAELDRLLASGAYDSVRPQSATNPGGTLTPVASALAHPFARRIAGIPEAMHFDRAAGVFTFGFRDDVERRPPDPTEIFLPEEPFGDSFEATVSPSGDVRFDPHTRRLLVYRSSEERHVVRVTAPR